MPEGEGPFERREEGQNPVALELQRLAEQDRVHRLGHTGRTEGGPQAGPYQSALGTLAQNEETAPEGTPPDSTWFKPERAAGRKAYRAMSDADLATSVEIARQSLENAVKNHEARVDDNGSVYSTGGDDSVIGNATDIMHEWEQRGHLITPHWPPRAGEDEPHEPLSDEPTITSGDMSESIHQQISDARAGISPTR